MKNVAILTSLLLLLSVARAQEEPVPDSASIQSLDSVVITGFEQGRNLASATGAVRVIEIDHTALNIKTSLVHSFNTVAGVRMEERSPGSYRVNIRGSSLRSPFGVRNVKVYWNGIPITDPGGNTYFNQFAANSFSSIEVFKGPAGSMYGAGTGGLVLMSSLDNSRPQLSLEYMGGSYGLQNIFASARMGAGNNKTYISYAHNEQDGYRVQSAMRRDHVGWSSLMKISGKQELQTALLFTDMYYQTPGGLTKAEFDKDPKAARPAAGGQPSAEQAKAAIYQTNLMAGVQHRYKLDTHWSNVTGLYVAYARIKNPAVRNYERRSEPHAGGRTVFAWEKKYASSVVKLVAGGELQHGFFNTQVFSNKQGNPDTLQTDDDIDYNTYSAFVQGDFSIANKWFITAGTSLNGTKVVFTRLNKYPITKQGKTYGEEWAPRFSVLRKFGGLSVLAIVSRGFSPPSISELLPSTGKISTDLEAEDGWNYEAILRHAFQAGKIYFRPELSVYYFHLTNALVQRRDLSGADYFINAGEVRQKGAELAANVSKPFSSGHFLEHAELQVAYAYSQYRYGSFTRDTIDLSGKTLPSVPANALSALLSIQSQKGLYCYVNYYAASKIFLNDVNTAFAEPYHLLGAGLGWKVKFKKNVSVKLYAGADNLLDEVYSLGNDINDPRGRYYNTAARRNYYAGVMLQK